MTSFPPLATAVQQVLTTAAEEAAAASACVQRVRRFSGATLVQTLVLGCLATPEPRLTDLTRMAATLGVTVSPQAIAQRFTPELVTCLAQVLDATVARLITADPVAIPVLARFAGVYVLDTSTIRLPSELAAMWPGCGNGSHHPAAALKLGVRWDLLHGTLAGPLLETGRTHDLRCAITSEPLPPGSLRLADLGFWSVKDLAHQQDDGILWLSRLQAQTAVLTPDGERFDLDAHLATTTATELEWEVCLGATTRAPARLLAQRVPPAVAATRRRRIRAEAKRRGQTPRHHRLDRADWLLLVTNVPADCLSLAEAVVLMRARWQIELLFKLWKSQGHIDEVRSANPWRVLAELYAKLVAMVLQHWTMVRGCWHVIGRSLVTAAAIVRSYAMPIALALGQPRHLRRVLARLGDALAQGTRHTRRRKHPGLTDLLLACEAAP